MFAIRRSVGRASPLARAYTNVNKPQLEKMLAQGTLLIDVRNPDEVMQTGLIEVEKNRAKVVPLPELEAAFAMNDTDFKKQYKFDKPKPDQEVAFTCRSGKRSVSASLIAEKAGLRNVFNYTGGASEWFA